MRQYRFALISALLPTLWVGAGIAAVPSYNITKSVSLGLPDRWDYLYFEPKADRVYIAHSTEVTVVDGKTGAIIGRVQGLTGVHGVVAVPELGKGYVSDRDKNAAVEFDLASLKAVKEIPVDPGADAVIFDSVSQRVFVMNGESNDATVIDAATDEPVGNIPLEGSPEFAVSDAAGHVFVNIADKGQVVRIHAKSAKVDARWPVPGCESPHGLSIDRQTYRLFLTCSNAKMVVVGAQDGRIFATLPIGQFTDASAFDPKRKLAFSANGDGTLSVISEQNPGEFVKLGEVPTKPGARTMAINTRTGRLYLVTSEFDINPAVEDVRRRYKIRPGTVQLLMLDPP